MELRRVVGLHQILAGNVITCLEPLLNCQCHFKFWGCSYSLKKNIFHRLKPEISIKKVQKQDLKKMQKDVGMECQKLCKQGRNDIIVKVNLQCPIPTFFYIKVANDVGMRLCKFTLTIISFLPCLHTFWHVIPTSFYIFNVF